MFASVTPELIASALTGLMFALAGIGVYAKTKGATGPKLDGAYRVEGSDGEVKRQLERIAQALEDMVAANKDSFQKDVRQRMETLDELTDAVEKLARDREDEERHGRRGPQRPEPRS